MPHLWVPVLFLREYCPFLGLPGFPSLSTVDVIGQIILGWDGGAVLCSLGCSAFSLPSAH